MIRIVSGSSDSVYSRCRSLYEQTERGIWIEEPPGVLRAWSLFRRAVPRLRLLIDEDRFEEVISRHRPVAALALGRLRDQFSPEERREFEQMAARLDSHLSHNWYIDRPALFGLAEVLGELTAHQDVQLFIPNLSTPDSSTLPLLMTMFRRRIYDAPDVVIGDIPGWNTFRTDENGLDWGHSPGYRNRVLNHLRSLHQPMHWEELADPDVPAELPTFDLPLDPLDDDFDGAAFALLEEPSFGIAEADQVLAAALRAFQVFSLDVALLLCLRLLARCPDLPDRQRLVLHEILALSAHNRQFNTVRGNERLVAFLELHNRKALELETDPAMHLALLYRLAVTLGRRKKDLAASLEIANRGIEEAQTLPIPHQDKIYHEVWLRNIRAYDYMRMRRFDLAFEDSTIGLAMANQLATPIEQASRDYKFTRTTIADNNLTLQMITGDAEGLEAAIQRNIGYIEEDPPSFGARFSAAAWIFVYREQHRLELAIRSAKYGLADAAGDYVNFRWYYLVQLGDLYYRLGELEEALAHIEQSRLCRPADLHDVPSIAHPAIASRIGLHEAAVQSFRSLLENTELGSNGLRAEALAALAMSHARRGSAQETEDTMNAAIEAAVEGGVRDTLLSVARMAGKAAVLLGHRQEAAEAFRQGIEIASVEGAAAPPAGDAAGVLIGLLGCGEGDWPDLRRALLLMPEALYEDPESWWDLPDLLDHLATWLPAQADHLEADERGALTKVMTAASQRKDCASRLIGLRSKLEDSTILHEFAEA